MDDGDLPEEDLDQDAAFDDRAPPVGEPAEPVEDAGMMVDPEGSEDADAPDPGDRTPPPIPAHADTAARMEALQAWLESGGPRFDMLALDSTLDRLEPPVLHLVAADQLHHRNATSWAEDPWVRKGIQAYFPDCHRLSLTLRPPGSALVTRREARAARRKALLARLRAEVEAEPLIQRLSETLGARIDAVCPDDETPVALEP